MADTWQSWWQKGWPWSKLGLEPADHSKRNSTSTIRPPPKPLPHQIPVIPSKSQSLANLGSSPPLTLEGLGEVLGRQQPHRTDDIIAGLGTAFRTFQDLKSEEGHPKFNVMRDLIPSIYCWAIHPEHVPSDPAAEHDHPEYISTLRVNRPSSVHLTRKQARHILANAFFLNVRKPEAFHAENIGYLGFDQLMSRDRVGIEKMLCMLGYFDRAWFFEERGEEDEVIVFARHVGNTEGHHHQETLGGIFGKLLHNHHQHHRSEGDLGRGRSDPRPENSLDTQHKDRDRRSSTTAAWVRPHDADATIGRPESESMSNQEAEYVTEYAHPTVRNPAADEKGKGSREEGGGEETFAMSQSKESQSILTEESESRQSNQGQSVLLPNWSTATKKIEPTHTSLLPGSMEQSTSRTLVDFANRRLHIHRIIPSFTQEEILLATHPESLIGILLCEPMAATEAITITNVVRTATYKGYADSFQFGLCEPSATKGDERFDILAIDASFTDQYSEKMVIRDLNKAYVGFASVKQVTGREGVATGGWGCGVFGGHPVLKFMQQVMAATMAGVHLDYATFGNQENRGIFELLLATMARRGTTVREAYAAISGFGGKRDEYMHYIVRRLNKMGSEE
ncbi:hypothetical protein DFS34DRAFT_374894 [Phlyctochytrium arcticum]|nr:hypothetical protein DFS34DRAFT_374894 [Phlyctochytrium arcticum]